MLYHPQPHYPALAIIRKCLAWIAGAASAFNRVRQDAAHLDTLRDGQLRELGIRRFDERGVRYYR